MTKSNLFTDRSKYTVSRTQSLADTIIIVNGLPGCGKTMMTPIVNGLPRVELSQFSYEIEYICALRYLEKIDPDGARSLIRLFADLQLYNVMMSRETNFRWTDVSGARFHPNRWQYLKRLFQPGDAAVLDRIRENRPILHLVTHLLFGSFPYLFDALGDHLLFVEVVRHPLYMLKQQHKYMHRWGTDIRDFSVWIDYEDRTLPWFAAGWERKYAESNSMDQAIHMIDEMQRLHDKIVANSSKSPMERLLIIPFERFVIDPWPYLASMTTKVGTEVSSTTRRMLKEQKVPRKMYADGMDRAIYREYGWEPTREGSTEAREFARRREFVAQYATAEGMDVLDRLCRDYEQKYLGGPQS